MANGFAIGHYFESLNHVPARSDQLSSSISTLTAFESACLDPGFADLSGSCSDLLFDEDTIISSYNSNKCPPPSKTRKRSSKPSHRVDLLELSKEAGKLGLHDLSRKFRFCCTDVIVLRLPQGSISITPLRCNHKLCPLCHAYHARQIRTRLDEIIYRAKTMITLTIATYKDHELRENIQILRRALRLLCQRKRKKQWVPFESGYYWRLELTDGKGFHPHFHVLSTHEWIDYHRLRARWRQCVTTAGGRGDHIWISATDKNTSREVSKYLSKDIDFFDSSRWPELCNGLYMVRTYGSGRALRLPPLETRGKKFICFGKDIQFFANQEMLDQFRDCKPGSIIRPDSEFLSRWTVQTEWDEFYGDSEWSSTL